MKKLLLTALLLTNLFATTKKQEEFKYIEPKDNQLLFYTPDNETKISSYCDNYIVYYPKDGYFIPTLRLLGMAIVYPDAPLAKQYFPDEVVQAGRQSYIVSLEKDPDQRLLLAITDAWRHLIKIKGEDEAFNLAIKVYNDSATACNKKYTGGEQEMFKLIR